MRFFLILIGGFLLATMAPLHAQTIPVHVQERSGLARTDEPVTLGVPFARGELMPATPLDVRAPDGSSVPTQTRPMAVWDDGSVRWLKVDFQATVDASVGETYLLQTGTTVPPNDALQVDETADAITVTTGPLRFQVSKTQFALFDQIWLDANGNREYSADEQLLDMPDAPFVVQAGRTYRANAQPPEQVEVEEAGPLCTVIKVAGRHYDGADFLLKYETRIYAYAGQPFVKIRHSYANGTSVTTLGDSESAALGERVDQYGLPLLLALGDDVTARLASGGTFDLTPGQELALVQEDRAQRSQPFQYRVRLDGTEVAAGQRASGLAQVMDEQRGVTVAQRYFWEKNPKGLRVSGNGTLTLDLLPSEEFLWPGMGTGDEVFLHFHAAEDADAAWQRAQAFGLDPLFAHADPEQFVASDAFYALQIGPSGYPAMDAYFDELTDNHLANREALDLYGNLHFGDVPRGQFEAANDLDFSTWGNNYYDAGLTAARMLAQTGDLRYTDVLVPMMRHWMETAAWNPYDADDWMRGFSPAYGTNHRGIGHFQHHYGEGVWAYYYLTGDERAREVGLRAADAIVDEQFYANDFVALREAYQRGSAVLEAYKNTRDTRYLDHARRLVGRILDTQDAFGLVGNVGEGGVFGGQTFMMALFSDTVWKLAQENPDPALTQAVVALADFMDEHARKQPGLEDYWNFWPAPGAGTPQPQGTNTLDGTVYWDGRALIAGTYAYAYDLTGDTRYRTMAQTLLADLWANIDYQGSEFWGKASCQAAKNVIHAAALVANGAPTRIEEGVPEQPVMLTLHGNYPNPFNPATTVVFDLQEAAQVQVVVFDLLGRAVLVVPPRALAAGQQHQIRLDASALSSGIYRYQVRAAGARAQRHAAGHMVLVR